MILRLILQLLILHRVSFSIDAQANIAGYRAVIEAAHQFGRLLCGQMTAAGNVKPAKVILEGGRVIRTKIQCDSYFEVRFSFYLRGTIMISPVDKAHLDQSFYVLISPAATFQFREPTLSFSLYVRFIAFLCLRHHALELYFYNDGDRERETACWFPMRVSRANPFLPHFLS